MNKFPEISMFSRVVSILWGNPIVKNFEDMYTHLDSMPACDRQTSCHGIVHTMHTRRAVKTRTDDLVTIGQLDQWTQ